MSTFLPFTGERFVPGAPGAKGEMWYEHWHRYHFVLPLVAGKNVLDIACGEGYGSALMSRTAATVAGVDIAVEAVAHARERYADLKNLRYLEGSCATLPFADASFDVAVSFETIEHIREQAQFLDEIKRVLVPGGVLILSSPNKAEYSDKRGFTNEFHVAELYREELAALLAPRFAHTRWLGQRNVFASVIAEMGATAGDALTVSAQSPDVAALPLPALYYLILATNNAATLEKIPARVSVFNDVEEWAFADYREIYQKYVTLAHRETAWQERIDALTAENNALHVKTVTAATPAAVEATTDSWLVRLAKRLSR